MRFRPFATTATPWLTLYLLVVSIGLPLQRVYCACVGENALMLAGTATVCELRHGQAGAPADAPVACHPGEPTPLNAKGCCSAPAPTPAGEAVTLDHDCDDTAILLAGYDGEFYAEAHPFPQAQEGPAALPAPPHGRGTYFGDLRALARQYPIRGPDDGPPLPYGRELLVAHQVFLL